MFMPKLILSQLIAGLTMLLLVLPLAGNSHAQSTGLGTPVANENLTEFDLIVGPDGTGLPAGGGNAVAGKTVYEAKCQACHGASGEGVDGSTRLVGGDMSSAENPLRTVGSFWPHATTLFDFIRRAMPADAPKSLSNEEVYQLTAYVLFLNGIVAQDFRLNKDSLPSVAMPNKDGFIDQSHLQ